MEVFSSIEPQTDYNFFYENNSLDLNQLFTLKVENEILENILSKILDEKKIYFKIISNQVVIKKVTYTINGKTMDLNSGEVIPFCSVIIEGTHTGTSSNENGQFLIKVDKRVRFSTALYFFMFCCPYNENYSDSINT